jgi:hypothetical protein
MQKLTLRFAVVSFIYYGFAKIEGMIMRMELAEPTTKIRFSPKRNICNANSSSMGRNLVVFIYRFSGPSISIVISHEKSVVESEVS